MLLALRSGGRDIPVDAAMDHVSGYRLIPNMTRRALQKIAKKASRPRNIGKSFEQAARAGPIHPPAVVEHMSRGRAELMANGTIRLECDLSQRIW